MHDHEPDGPVVARHPLYLGQAPARPAVAVMLRSEERIYMDDVLVHAAVLLAPPTQWPVKPKSEHGHPRLFSSPWAFLGALRESPEYTVYLGASLNERPNLSGG